MITCTIEENVFFTNTNSTVIILYIIIFYTVFFCTAKNAMLSCVAMPLYHKRGIIQEFLQNLIKWLRKKSAERIKRPRRRTCVLRVVRFMCSSGTPLNGLCLFTQTAYSPCFCIVQSYHAAPIRKLQNIQTYTLCT